MQLLCSAGARNFLFLLTGINDDADNSYKVYCCDKPESIFKRMRQRSVSGLNLPHPHSGSLYGISVAFYSTMTLNMTKIESRPVKGRPWEVLHFLWILKENLEDPARQKCNPGD